MSLLLELWPMAKLVVKQSAKAHGPIVCHPGAFESVLHKITLNSAANLSWFFVMIHFIFPSN